MSNLSSRVLNISKKVEALHVKREVLLDNISSTKKSVDNIRYDISLNQKASEFFKHLLDDMLKENIGSISDLVTNALKHIIYDQDLEFKIIQEFKSNKIAMKFVLKEGGIEADPMSSFGGGPAVISSFILRLAVMAKLNMTNLLILDESMAALANRYVPNAANFMRQLSEDTGINILMVTHNNEFMENAHTSYEGSSFTGEDGIKSIKLTRKS